MDDIKVVELFAGVGGFRLGLEQTKNRILMSIGQISGSLHVKYNMLLIVIIRDLTLVNM